MRRLWLPVCAVVGLALGADTAAQSLVLPARLSDAMTGSALAREIEGLGLEEREVRIVEEILAGNVPASLRPLRAVRVATDRDTLIFWTTPDYLAIGSDDDQLRVPLTPGSAQRIADAVGLSLPTPAMVDAIWAQADHQLAPAPIPPGPEMTTVPVFRKHSRRIDAQLRQNGIPPGSWVAGHKKDVVLSRGLASRPGHVAIYGWHQLDGHPIQPLYLGHTADWVDYSHGIRLVSRGVWLNRQPVGLWTVLSDPALASLLSDEGPLAPPWFARPD